MRITKKIIGILLAGFIWLGLANYLGSNWNLTWTWIPGILVAQILELDI